MNLFNNFITQEGHSPVDQSNVKMDCDGQPDCRPYLYKSSSHSYSQKDES